MIDMRTTIAPKSDQLNSDDLIGRTMTITVTKVSGNDSKEQPVSMNFEGDNGKPYKPCLSMRRVLIHVWGHEAQKYVGRSMVLYCDDKVKFGGLEVGGIRISHMSHITSPVIMALTASKANKKPYKVEPLAVAKEDPEVALLKTAGENAAQKGVAAYTTWKDSLTPDKKEKIKSFHSAWAKKATAADEPPPPSVPDDLPEDDDIPM